MNDYFSNIGSDLSSQISDSETNPCDYLKKCLSNFRFEEITMLMVLYCLNSSKSTKASGMDKISAKLVKDSSAIIAPSLSKLFNKSLSSGVFPDDWKIARISPVFKSGDSSLHGNYRPISVISIISKIFEKIVCQQFSKFLENNKVLTNQQSNR